MNQEIGQFLGRIDAILDNGGAPDTGCPQWDYPMGIMISDLKKMSNCIKAAATHLGEIEIQSEFVRSDGPWLKRISQEAITSMMEALK